MNVTCSAEPCPVILNATCVFYQGENLVYTGINTNDNLETALQKIDAKFGDAFIGYIFDNGVIQTAPGQPVRLGGSLVQNTIINSAGYTFEITGSIESGAFITTGGTSSQFVKGDGSLDSTSYQPAGSYITALTGDGTATGPGSAVLTLANVNLLPGTYGGATSVPVVTVNSKGLATSVTSVPISFPSGQLLFSGDVSGSGFTGSITTLTLATVNSNVYGTNTALKFAVNGKGLVTSAAPLTNLDIFSIIGYTPVPPTRTITINGVTQNLSANRSWTIPSGGTVTSIATTSPITGGTITTSGTIGITQATTSTDGYLSSTDWNTFNGKQPQLNGTGFVVATGTAISYDNSTYYLASNPNNYIPLTALSAGTGISYNNLTGVITNSAPDQVVSLTGAGTTTTSGTYPNFTITSNDQYVGTVTSVGLTSATSGVTIGSSPITTSGNISLTIATASGSQNGLLSSTDWTTFNSKYNLPSLTSGSVLFSNGTTIAQDNANFFWDDTNNRLGVGTNNPSYTVHAISSASTIGAFRNSGAALGQLLVGNTVSDLILRVLASGDSLISSDTSKYLAFGTNGASERMRITSGGNLLIGSTTDSGEKLQVTGTMKVTGASTFNDNVTINQTGSNIQQIINSSVSTNPSITQYKIGGSAGWEHGMASVTNGYSYIFSYGTFGTGTAKFTLTSAGAATFASSVTLSSTASAFVVLDNTTATTGKQWRASSAANGRFFLTNVTDGLDAITLLTTGAATFNSSVTATSFIPSGSTAPTNGMYLPTTNTLAWSTNSAERMRLDASGNLGLGVTPSAWGTSALGTNTKAIEISQLGSSVAAGSGGIVLSNNTYSTNSNYIYARSSFPATLYLLNTSSGQYQWYTAPSGTAGNAITFTQAMTLTAAGRLLLGTTTESTYLLDVNGAIRSQSSGTAEFRAVGGSYGANYNTTLRSNSSAQGVLQLGNNAENYIIGGNTATGGFLIFKVNGTTESVTTGTEAMRITSGGNLLVGTTTDSGEKLVVSGTSRITGATYLATSSGSVGIGTTSPSEKLDVNGNIQIANAGYIKGSTYTGTKITIDNDLTLTANRDVYIDTGVVFKDSGSVGIGTTSPNASAILQTDSTTKGFLPPRMTTTQKNAISSPAAGLQVYDTTLNQMSYYNGTTWVNF